MARRKTRRKASNEKEFTDSFMFKFSTKISLTLIVVVIFLTIVQCDIRKPEAPEWNTTFTVPVVNRTYPMEEIIRKIDQEGISMDADSNVIYEITEDIDTISLDADNLTTGDLSYSVSQTLGVVDINVPSLTPVTVSYASIIGLATGVVPPATFNVDNAMPTITDFNSATFDNGAVRVVIHNELGLDLDAVSVALWDASSNTRIDTADFAAGVLSGVEDSIEFSLAGKTVSNQLEVRATCHTPGGTVLSASGKQLTTAVNFTNDLSVSSATAKVPGLSRVFSEQVDLGEDDAIYRARLTSGVVQLDISNNTALDATLQITLPDLNSGGSPLVISRAVSGSSNTIVNIDLDGYDLAPVDSTVPQAIGVNVVATVPGSGDNLVSVNSSDNFSVTAGLSNLSFDQITGVFATTEATIDPTVESIDVPRGFDSLQLTTAILTLEVENGVNLPGDVDILLTGSNGKTFNLVGTISAGLPGMPATTLLIDSTVADFLFPVPEEITISGSTSFGDGVSVATINADDYVFARVHVLAPMEVILGRTEVEADIESEDLEQDDMDAITEHALEARFVYEITNHLPLGVDVSIVLGGDSISLMSTPQVTIDGLGVTAAPTVAGIVSGPSTTGLQTIILDSLEIQVLNNDSLFIGQEIILHSTNGQPVRLTNNDYITITGYVEVDYRFDGEF